MNHKKNINYRPDIDGLRAIAVLLVIAFHVAPTYVRGGFVGVDIFFVISGYLITGIILKSLRENQFSFLDFYARRIKRIFPALFVVLLSCLIFGWFTLFSHEYAPLARHVMAGAGFASNIFYWLESGYFADPAIMTPLLHLWSLGVEEQFYLLWPLLIVLLYKKTKNIIPITVLIGCISFTLFIGIGTKNPDTAFYMPFTRFWGLMVGAFLAEVMVHTQKITHFLQIRLPFFVFETHQKVLRNAGSLGGLLLIIASLYLISEDNFYKGWGFLAVLGTFLIIMAGQHAYINKKILSHRILVFIGLISYPLYLWHWPLLSFARIIHGKDVPLFIELILVAMSCLLAWSTYRYIEKPIRFRNIEKIPRILMVSMMAVLLSGCVIYINKGFDFRLPAQEKAFQSIKVTTKDIEANRELCHKLYPLKTSKAFQCLMSGDSKNKVFIIGDSHARAIYFGYHQAFEERGYSLVNMGIAGCNILDSRSKSNKNCNTDLKNVIDLVIRQNPKAVIISNNAVYKPGNSFERGMDETLSYLYDVAPVIWITKTPRPQTKDFTACISRSIFSSRNNKDCSISRILDAKMINNQTQPLENIKAKYPKIHIFDPNRVLCNSSECFMLIDNQLLYEDFAFHLSLFGSQYLAEGMPIAHLLPDLSKDKI